ncbi:hypothetical protein A6V39_05455 [Candidatus Mycoplasma haematobovis]|uniref:DNA 3'-5' helicase n=1 Tax=Candidatus Mycoplasma haematobovis TaxID=432608 RepID=A0A1A9QDF6_9MOLU|nr:ATP-dependent helicase [Candidatus Mycoplasma haematobovis]OAL09740.1 hypothetical protein A6V39_05455 [Candidatus Mycoplasma haematobovis]
MESSLNKTQKEAVYSLLNKHTLVIAPAGTGKTEVLVSRICYLLENGIKPEEICAVTFTNFAASEMSKRIKERFNDVRKTPSAIGTIHSLYGTILRHHIDILDIGLNHMFKIADEDQKNSILRIVNSKYYKKERKLKDLISKHKISKHLNPNEATNLEDQGLLETYEKYLEILKKRWMLDYDDLLILVDRIFDLRLDILEHWRNKYKVILVDECQDLNPLQFKLITRLIGENSIFFGVGDPHQCIYAFAGAQKDIFNKFKEFFKDNYLQISLLENYRSTKKIVDYSNQIKLFEPYAKVVSEEEGTIETIKTFDLINKLKDADLSRWAILFRQNKHAKDLIKQAIENKIPFKTSKFELLEKDEIQKIISYLRLIYFDNFNPFKKLLQLKYLELSQESKSKIFEKPNPPYLTLYEKWMSTDRDDWFENEEDNEKLSDFLKKLKRLREAKVNNLSVFVESLIPSLFEGELKQSQKDNISLFVKWLDNIQPEKTSESAVQVVLDIEDKAKFFKEQKDSGDFNYLSLITIHKSKGLGWDNVAILEYDLLQESAKNRDEESEFLEYVSVTRAKKNLFLIK